jgi:glycosyltransferase involved in cell wall biosynthesis
VHILLIHQVFVTPDEGGGTRHYEMCRYLARRGHKVTVIASQFDYLTGLKKSIVEENREGIHIYYSRAYSGVHKSIFHRGISFFSFSISAFKKGIKIKGIDLVWGTSPPLFQSLASLILARIKKVPYIFEVRDLWLDFAKELGLVKNPIVFRVFKTLENLIYRMSDSIVVNSPGFIPYVKNSVPVSRVRLIPNGVDIEQFKHINGKVTEEFRRRFDLGDKFVVLYAGNIGIANDIENILNAAKIIKVQKSDIVFVFFGGGMNLEKYKIHRLENNLSNVYFFPSQPKRIVPAMLQCADVCLATLKNIELFKTTYPNKVFDYMAAGKPTILAIDGVIRDLIERANAGIHVGAGDPNELANAVLYYYRNRQKIMEHGMNGRDYVRKYFDRKKITQQFTNFLENISSYDNQHKV